MKTALSLRSTLLTLALLFVVGFFGYRLELAIPKGSMFMLDGYMASSPGLPVGTEINALSVYQNTLAPPPSEAIAEEAVLKRGATVFEKANCATCHSGRYFTNHDVIPEEEIQAQPSRAVALAKFPQTFTSPETYPNSTAVPLPTDPSVIPVPVDMTPQKVRDLAYAVNSAGGYKVQNLIGLYVTAPYLNDGGVAASANALNFSDSYLPIFRFI